MTGDAAVSGARSTARSLWRVLLAGFVFLLPFWLVLILVLKIFETVRPVAAAFRSSVLPASAHEPAATILTVLLLVAMTLAAGLFARSAAGRKVFLRIETAFLMRLPFYTVFQTMIRQQTAAPEDAVGRPETQIVLVAFDDLVSLGFLVDRLSDGRAVVYLPGAPSPISGSVAIVEAERLTATRLTAADVFGRMRQLGVGLDASLNRA